MDNSGEIVYDGFAIEIVDKISKFSGFDYDLYDSPDGQYGVYNRETGLFSGMIGELIAGVSDWQTFVTNSAQQLFSRKQLNDWLVITDHSFIEIQFN